VANFFDQFDEPTPASPDAGLLDALIQQESGGNPNAVNARSGAKGLAQAMDATARDPGFGVKPLADPFDPAESRRFADEYLGAMMDRYKGNQRHALAAYNWGPGNVDQWLQRGGNEAELPAETQDYIHKITTNAAPAAAPAAGGNFFDQFDEAPAEPAAPEGEWQPTGWERFAENAKAGFRETITGEVVADIRRGDPQRQHAADLDMAIADAEKNGGVGTELLPNGQMSPYAGWTVEDMKTARDQFAGAAEEMGAKFGAEEAAAKQRFDTMAEGTMGEKLAYSLPGQLAGGLPDPTNLVPVARGATLAKTAGKGILANAGLSGVSDVYVQNEQIERGARDEFDPAQTAAQVAVGGVIGGTVNAAPEVPRLLRDWFRGRTGREVEAATPEDMADVMADPEVPAEVKAQLEALGFQGDQQRAANVIANRRMAEAERILPQAEPPSAGRPMSTDKQRKLLDAEISQQRAERDALERGVSDTIGEGAGDVVPEAANLPRRPQPTPEVLPVDTEGRVLAGGPDLERARIERARRDALKRKSEAEKLSQEQTDAAGPYAVQAPERIDGEYTPASKPNVPADRTQNYVGYEVTEGKTSMTEAELARNTADPARIASMRKSQRRAEQLSAEIDTYRQQLEELEKSAEWTTLTRKRDTDTPLTNGEIKTLQALRQKRLDLRMALDKAEDSRYDVGYDARGGSVTGSGSGDRPFHMKSSEGLTPDQQGFFRKRAEDKASSEALKRDIDLEAEWAKREEIYRRREEEAKRSEEARKRWEEDRERQARAKAEARYSDGGAKAERTFGNSAKPDADGRYATDDFGFVRSDKGGPIKFKGTKGRSPQREAAEWVRDHANKSPDQVWELHNHPSGNGITVKLREVRKPEPPKDGPAGPTGSPKGEPKGEPRRLGSPETKTSPSSANGRGGGPAEAASAAPERPATNFRPQTEAEAPEIRPQAEARNPSPKDVAAAVGKKPAGKPQSIKNFLRARGGLNLSAARKEWGQGWYEDNKQLLRTKGMNLDTAREAAAEAGYLRQDSDINDLFDALDRDTMLPEDEALAEAQGQWEASRDAFVEEYRNRTAAGETREQIMASWTQRADDMAKDAGIDPDDWSTYADTDAVGNEPRGDTPEAEYGEDIPWDDPRPEAAGEAPRAEGAPRSDAGSQQRGNVAPDIEKTDQGDQFVMPGAERRHGPRADYNKDGSLKPEQKGIDGLELFDPDSRPTAQEDLLSGVSKFFKEEAGSVEMPKVDLDYIKDFLSAVLRAPAALWDAGKVMFLSNDAYMRGMAYRFKSDAMIELADIFHAAPASGRAVKETYHEAVDRHATQNLSRLRKVVDTIPKGLRNAELRDLLVNPRKNEGKTPLEKAAKAVGEMLKREIEYRKAAGEDIGNVRDGYFPRIVDLDKAAKNADEFKRLVAQLYQKAGHKNPKEAADAYYEALLHEHMGLDQTSIAFELNQLAVARTAEESRVFGKEADNLLKGFYHDDVFTTLVAYFNGSAKRAEFVRRFGMKGAVGSKERADWLKAHGKKSQLDVYRDSIREEAAASGENVEDVMADVTKFVMSNLGTLGASTMLRRNRRLISGFHTWNVLSTLGRTLFTSLPEATLVGMRTGSVKLAFNGMVDTFHEFGRAVARMPKSEAYEYAEKLAIVNDAIIESILQSRLTGLQDSALQQKAMTGFFKGIGLHQFTEASRVAALKGGRAFIKQLAQDVDKAGAKGKRAEFYLKELGIEEPRAFAGALKKAGYEFDINDVLRREGHAGDYGKAIARFVDQTIMRPNRAQKPRWANHPLGSIFFALSSYSYAFKKNVLDRQVSLTKQAIAERDLGYLASGAVGFPMLLGMTYLVDTYVRPAIFGSSYNFEEESGMKAMLRTLDRAGVTAAASPLINAFLGTKYQRDVVNSLSGPIVGRIGAAAYDVGKAFTSNTPNTDTAERNLLRQGYRLGLLPLVSGLLAGGVSGASRLAGLEVMSSHRLENAFVDTVGGAMGLHEKKKKGNRPRN
jgi:hypothetical protein